MLHATHATHRFERLKEIALEYAFLLKTQGMLDTKPAPGSNAGKDSSSSSPAGGAAPAAAAASKASKTAA
jgi:hypothetical protein